MRVILTLVPLGLLFHLCSARFISDNICLAMPNGQKLPVTDDCSSYIVCEYNVQSIRHCTKGLLFDPIVNVCNWANKVKCGSTPTLSPEFNTTVTSVPTKAPTSPPFVPTAPTRKPEVTTTTPAPIYVPTAPTATASLHPGTAPTAAPSKPTTVTTTTSRPILTVAPNRPPLQTTGNPYPQCSPSEFTFIAHPSACESYYICAYGSLILHSCGHGVYWNTKTNQCDFPENTDCSHLPNPAAPDTSTPSIETSTASSMPNCRGADIFHRYPNDCHKYYICIGSSPILMSCPAGYLWNDRISQCDHPPLYGCPE